MEENQKKPEERLEFLKREEIVTMQKDVARLRETEAQKERERIAAITPGEKIPEASKLPAGRVEKEEEGIEKGKVESLIPKFPKKPSPFQKVLIRIIAVSVLFLFVGFFYWFFGIRKTENPPEEEITPGEEITPTGEEVTEGQEIVIPLSLISVNATETLEISSPIEASTSLPDILGKKFDVDSFVRILIENKTENKILGLKEFFELFQVKTPEGFLDKLNDDFTLFIYSSIGANRLGFAAEIKDKAGLVNALNSWEPTMEKDTEALFTVLGKQGMAPVSYFRTASYKGTSFRYISFPPANFGICYSMLDDYFLWTTSGESMTKVLNKLTQ